MENTVTVLGPKLFESKPGGQLQSSIGTVFPRHGVIVTDPPLHALQRDVFKTWLSAPEQTTSTRVPNQLKLEWEATESVDVFFSPDGYVIIRPELERLDLALNADEMLQTLCNIPRYKIMFLSVQDKRVRQALRERGELWRIRTAITKNTQLFNSKVAIANVVLYYYNPHTGTRYITCADFCALSALPDDKLASQLQEIASYAIRRNRHGHPEVSFFGPCPLKFGSPNFFGVTFTQLDPVALRDIFSRLSIQFKEATDENLQGFTPQDKQWQTQLHDILSYNHEIPSEKIKDYGDVVWLPGGAFVNGEFHFAPVDDPDPAAVALWDPLARGFITNFIREHSNIEYINLGKIAQTEVRNYSGRRGVYLAEIKIRGEQNHRVLLLRLLRWGIRERLEEKEWNGQPKTLVNAVFETEEYIDYTLDRRLGCLQLGMHLPPQVHMRRLTEEYAGSRKEFKGRFFPVIYFERDFILGVPSHKIPERKLAETRYAFGVAKFLGKAAAANLIVGRCSEAQDNKPMQCVFDSGNELIVEGSDGLPAELTVVAHSGAFVAWRQPSLTVFAEAYAAPVNQRVHLVADPRAFAEAYLDALKLEMEHIQMEYGRQRNAFDGLFKHLPRNEHGNFAHRWDCVLKRLREAEIPQIIKAIRKHITVLTTDSEESPSI